MEVKLNRERKIEGDTVIVHTTVEESMTVPEFNKIWKNKEAEIERWEKTESEAEGQLKLVKELTDDEVRKLDDPVFKSKLELFARKQTIDRIKSTLENAKENVEKLTKEANELVGEIKVLVNEPEMKIEKAE